ncbi:hypothetical protein Pelo_3682 [Pelomyxa schiedti]|nr:hypothetical protein Pelo_3682 [Pelomyxa schiedti]
MWIPVCIVLLLIVVAYVRLRRRPRLVVVGRWQVTPTGDYEGREVVVGHDVIMSSGPDMRFCYRFSGILSGELLLKSLREMVNQFPQLCGSLRWAKSEDNAKKMELVWGGRNPSWAPVLFTILKGDAPPPCTRNSMGPYMPSLPRSSRISVNLVIFPSHGCSYITALVDHGLTDAAGWGNLFTKWSALCCGADSVSRNLTFARYQSLLLSKDTCTTVEERVGSSTPRNVQDLQTSFSRWCKFSPLSSWYRVIPRLCYWMLLSQSTVFRFDIDLIQEFMKKCNGCTKNTIMCALIIGSIHALSPHQARKCGGSGLTMTFDLRGNRSGTTIPEGFIGNGFFHFRKWIPLESLEAAATALKEKGPTACVEALAPLIQRWVTTELTGTTGIEMVCWFSRVHQLGLDSKLGAGLVASIADGDTLLDSVTTRGIFENVAFPREDDGQPARPVEMCLPMLTMKQAYFIAQSTGRGDRDIYISLPRSQLNTLSHLWESVATRRD